MPCESWPARLALTQPTATAPASSSDAPAALSSAAPMRVKRSACTEGMGFSSPEARAKSGSCLLSRACSQSGGRRASGKRAKLRVLTVRSRGSVPLRGMRMSGFARKIAGPRQEFLIGERLKKNPRAVGVSGAIPQRQIYAAFGRHRLIHAKRLERRAPPPSRGRRSILLTHSAPPRVFVHDTLELHVCGGMHQL